MKEEAHAQFDHTNARRYSEIASHYNADWRGSLTPDLKQTVDQFTSLVGKPPKKVMDAGCGTGKISMCLAEMGYNVSCLDMSEGMLRETIHNALEQRVDVDTIQANMRSQCFTDESFDAIWSMASLVHLEKRGKVEAISEFARILVPGGVLYISVQNLLHKKHLQRVWQSYGFWLGFDEENQYYIIKKTHKEIQEGMDLVQRFRQGYAYLDGRHWYFPTKPELTSLLDMAGFEIITSNSTFAQRNDIFAIKR